jgi:hypothetical protein
VCLRTEQSSTSLLIKETSEYRTQRCDRKLRIAPRPEQVLTRLSHIAGSPAYTCLNDKIPYSVQTQTMWPTHLSHGVATFGRATFERTNVLRKVSWATYLDEVFEGEGLATPQRELPCLGPRNEAPPTGGPLHTQQESAMSRRREAQDLEHRKVHDSKLRTARKHKHSGRLSWFEVDAGAHHHFVDGGAHFVGGLADPAGGLAAGGGARIPTRGQQLHTTNTVISC